MLKVIAVQEVTQVSDVAEIDHYVPVSFGARSRPVGGARYIRFGDMNRHLLELQFPADSLELMGFTYVLG
jgi:hypothetical protein